MTRHAIRIVVAAAIGAALVGVGGTATAAAGPPRGHTARTMETSASPVMDPNGLCDNHDADGDCRFAYAGPGHRVEVTLPAHSPQEQAILDYAGRMVDEFEAAARPLSALDPAMPGEILTISGRQQSAGGPSAGTQSTVVEVHEELQTAAHPATWFASFNYDNATGTPFTFDDLFRPGTRPLEVVMPIVARQLSTDAGRSVAIDPAVGLDPANYRNFALGDDAVTFYFDTNSIHSAFDASSVTVPRSAIAELLNPGI